MFPSMKKKERTFRSSCLRGQGFCDIGLFRPWYSAHRQDENTLLLHDHGMVGGVVPLIITSTPTINFPFFVLFRLENDAIFFISPLKTIDTKHNKSFSRGLAAVGP